MIDDKLKFGDIIPDLATQLGVTRLDYLHVAIKQARYYGFEETAQWFEKAEKRLRRAIKEEWRVDDPEITYDTTGL